MAASETVTMLGKTFGCGHAVFAVWRLKKQMHQIRDRSHDTYTVLPIDRKPIPAVIKRNHRVDPTELVNDANPPLIQN